MDILSPEVEQGFLPGLATDGQGVSSLPSSEPLQVPRSPGKQRRIRGWERVAIALCLSLNSDKYEMSGCLMYCPQGAKILYSSPHLVAGLLTENLPTPASSSHWPPSETLVPSAYGWGRQDICWAKAKSDDAERGLRRPIITSVPFWIVFHCYEPGIYAIGAA